MFRKILIKIFCLFILIQNVSHTLLFSQEIQKRGPQRVQMIAFDFLRNIMIDSVNVDRLIGNVVLEHNGAVMTCDSAYIYPGGKFEAFGHAVVTGKSGAKVIGDSILYNSANDLAIVRGKIVYLIDSTANLRTTAIDFNTKDEIGYFENEGTIKDSARLLESKRGYFFSKRNEFEFIGTVQVRTEEYVLRSDSLKYNTETKLFTFFSSTHIWGNSGYLFSNSGWYDSEGDRLFFTNNSYLLTEKQEMFADSIYYENKTQKGKLYSNIQITDTVQKTIAFGDFGNFNVKSEDFELKKDPSVVFYDNDNEKNDSLFMRADIFRSVVALKPRPKVDTTSEKTPTDKDTTQIFDTIQQSDHILESVFTKEENDSISTEDLVEQNKGGYSNDSILAKKENAPTDSTYRKIYGIHNVRMFNKDMQASCDSLYFDSLDSIAKMFINPIVWNNSKAQVTSDSVYAFIVNGGLDRAEFYDNGFIIMPEDATDTSKFSHQIKGKKIVFYFKNNELDRMNVSGNVQTIFYSTSDQAATFNESATFVVYFKNRKVRRAVYNIKPTMESLPLSIVTSDKANLVGFLWKGELRPRSSSDICNRTYRSSKREECEKIEKPGFPITERMDELEMQK